MPSFKVKTKIKSDFKDFHKLTQKLLKQNGSIADVGHFDGKPHPFGKGETFAEISLINQQANEHSPARPYMVKALESPVFVKEYNKAVMRIAEGKSTIAKELPKLATLLKEVMMGVIQVAGPGFARNSPETIERKGRDEPLIDTANLVNDIEIRLTKSVSIVNDVGIDKVARNVQ